VVEAIGYAKKNKIPGALISIDMAKAFDTVSHEFLNDCYTFFNFGANFQNMLRTVGKDRTACILMDDGSLSENFVLNSGRPQGEVLSPVQYNIGEQILLFKIELDPGIKSLFNNILGPNTPFPITCNNVMENKTFRMESEGETNKAEGFADDANILTRADQESIKNAEILIERFSEISGLKCNFSKSSVMYIGTKTTGIITKFPEVHSYTLLGIEIDSEATLLAKNFSKAKKNIQHIINFWIRFDLSLPGRIAIAKTFLLSQLNYFGLIFMPPDPDLISFQTQIDNFCLKNLKFTNEKRYATPEEGGLGLINLKDSLISQQSLWF
jgi:mannosylglycoprotein endo-beta-mannosidase